jgi:hypothetical protein
MERWSLLSPAESASVNSEMSTDPDQIRAQIAELLADVPDPAQEGSNFDELAEVGHRHHCGAARGGPRPAGARAGIGREGLTARDAARSC